MRLVVVAIACAACGGHAHPKPPPPKPPAVDAAKLAAQLHEDLVHLADIAHRLKGSCAELVVALRPHVAQMRAHADDAERARADPDIGVQLRREADGYAASSRGLADAIGSDLAEAYTSPSCATRDELRAVIDQIPELQ